MAALAAIVMTGSAWAQTGTVKGTVQDHAGVALAGAEVRIEGTMLHASSDDAGRYEIGNVPAGAHQVRALMMGYKSEVHAVTVEAGAVATVDFHLEHSVIPVQAIEVVVGSRAKHTAADELAVPVDVYNREVLLRQGSTETSQMLQALSPAVNFPRQSVTDATDVVRPFTLRGLSPDQTLVLVNGLRRHQTALVNTFAYGMPAGSSGVDLNALPASAIDRVEVLRDGAAAQYGSDAIAGVVNVVMRRGAYSPFVNVTGGQYFTEDYPRDGKTFNVNGGWGLNVGKGSLSLAAEALDREATNRAWADPFEDGGPGGVPDVVDPNTGKVIQKNNTVPQPNHHWGDGYEKDVLTLGSFNYPLSDHSQLYAFGGYSHRNGNGQGYRRYWNSDRNWTQIYPQGFLPEFRPKVTDYSLAGGWKGESNGWALDAGATFGHSGFRYELANTLNSSLGPSLTSAGPSGIPNQTEFFAGELHRDEFVADVNGAREMELGLPKPVNVALGAAWRRERWVTIEGEKASWINGGVPNQNGGDPIPGSQVFPGFAPSDASDSRRDNVGAYLDLESNLTTSLLANVAGRFENYSDFGSLLTGKLALRLQPDKHVTFRAAGSTGFRAPGLSQIHFSKVVTNIVSGTPEEVGIFPVNHPAARALGAKDLDPEKSINASAGVAVTPVDNLTVTLDGYWIKIDDRIVLSAILDDAASQTALTNAGFTDISGVQYFTNGLKTETSGVDITADYRMPIGSGRSLDWNLSVNYGRNLITGIAPLTNALPGTTETLLDETATLAITKERPDWRGSLSAEYTQGPGRALVRASYYGIYSSSQPAFTDGYREDYPARTLVDLEAGWKLFNGEIAVGAKNLLDEYPGKAKLDFNNNFGVFPWAAASPFGYNGRYVYTKLSWTLPR